MLVVTMWWSVKRPLENKRALRGPKKYLNPPRTYPLQKNSSTVALAIVMNTRNNTIFESVTPHLDVSSSIPSISNTLLPKILKKMKITANIAAPVTRPGRRALLKLWRAMIRENEKSKPLGKIWKKGTSRHRKIWYPIKVIQTFPIYFKEK